jgi:monofunctional glycosyltransferase
LARHTPKYRADIGCNAGMTIKRFILRSILALCILVLLYQLWMLLHIVWWVKFNPSTSAFMQSNLEAMQQKDPNAQIKHAWMRYDNISKNLKRAVIAAEDAKFNDHEGFDWDGIQKAFEKNKKKGKIVAGGSTISQQLAKNLFLSTKRTPWRKAQEAVITVMLEQVMSKRRILEIYLNVIEWGHGVFGAEAASRYYYKTGAGKLSSWQAAKLAAMIPNPKFYDDHRNTRYLNRRISSIQRWMPSAEVPY